MSKRKAEFEEPAVLGISESKVPYEGEDERSEEQQRSDETYHRHQEQRQGLDGMYSDEWVTLARLNYDRRTLTETSRYPTGGLNRDCHQHEPVTFLQPRYHNMYYVGELLYGTQVCRADNRRYYVGNELTNTIEVHTLRHCPTFGNCSMCFHAGPIGEHCVNCRQRSSGYSTYKLITTFRLEEGGGPRIINRRHYDAEGLGRFVGHTSVQWPVGRRHIGWRTVPEEELPEETFINHVERAIYYVADSGPISVDHEDPRSDETRASIREYMEWEPTPVAPPHAAAQAGQET